MSHWRKIMAKYIGNLFDFLGVAFDAVPFLKRVKGYRTLIGLVVLAATYAPQVSGHIDAQLMTDVRVGIITFTGLALNAKGRAGE